MFPFYPHTEAWKPITSKNTISVSLMSFFKKNVTFLHKYLVQDTKNSLSEKNRIPAAYFPCTCNRKHIIFDLGNRHLQSIIARLLLIIIAHLLLSIIARTTDHYSPHLLQHCSRSTYQGRPPGRGPALCHQARVFGKIIRRRSCMVA